MRDRSYRATELGQEVGRFLRHMRSQDLAARSRGEYESTLYRFALDHADLRLADFVPPVGTERLEEFIDNTWGDKAAGTRAKNISILRSFFTWAYERERIAGNPMLLIKRPRRKKPDRHSHPPAKVTAIISAQPLVRDRCALLLLARLGLRKNELRLLRIDDIDLEAGTLKFVQKGGDTVTHPIVFPDVLQALAEHFTVDGRNPASGSCIRAGSEPSAARPSFSGRRAIGRCRRAASTNGSAAA